MNKNAQHAERPDWEQCVDDVAEHAMREQSPGNLLTLRSKLYDLLAHAIPPVVIIKVQYLLIT